ncbi:hypothetical protein [Chamaesiphon sp.]|uniref:hypothetical protein n=1 Tax=Chamaesiphon sp. TaxID=2814140 RepID=UPI0035935B46
MATYRGNAVAILVTSRCGDYLTVGYANASRSTVARLALHFPLTLRFLGAI